jgi:predicted regulator of Ras-like GTPase activity (Roadblock/LC7/MglB family)
MTNPMPSLPPTVTPDTPTAQQADSTPAETMEWLLDDFVRRVPGVTHALIGSKDGLLLMASSTMRRDWAETVAASLSGYASLAAGTLGPTGKKEPAKQIALEFDDYLFLVMVSGLRQQADFSHRPVTSNRTVETVLGVYAGASADAGLVGYEMSKLIKRFPQHMHTPIRQELTDAGADGAHAGIR